MRLIRDILVNEYLATKQDGGRDGHAKAVDEVIVALNEQFTE